MKWEIIVAIVLLLFPVVDALLRIPNPDYEVVDIDTRSIFRYEEGSVCGNVAPSYDLKRVPDLSKMPALPSRYWLKTSIDKSVIKGTHFMSTLSSIVKLGSVAVFKGHCYGSDELSIDGYNLSDTQDNEKFHVTEEFRASLRNNMPSSISTEFLPTEEMYHMMPEYSTNYRIGHQYSETLESSMLLGWLMLYDLKMGLATHLFNDDCTFYYDCQNTYQKQMITKEDVQKNYAEFFDLTFNRMNFFESVLGKPQEGIFYFSYYPYHGKSLVLIKTTADSCIIYIDNNVVEFKDLHPLYLVDTPKLENTHTLQAVCQDTTYELEFKVSDTKLLPQQGPILSDKNLLIRFHNLYEEDIMIENMIATDGKLTCNLPEPSLIKYKPEITNVGNWVGVEYSTVNLTCSGPFQGSKIRLDSSITWKFVSSPDSEIIEGEMLLTPQLSQH